METNQLIEQLADKLGTTAERLFGVLVNQAPINSKSNLIMYVIGLILAYFAFKNAERLRKKPQHEFEPIMILSYLFCFSIFLLIAMSLRSTIFGFTSPEYWALKQILNHY